MHQILGTTSVTPHAWSSWTYLANRCLVCHWFRKKSWKSLTRCNSLINTMAKIWESRHTQVSTKWRDFQPWGSLRVAADIRNKKKTPVFSQGSPAPLCAKRKLLKSTAFPVKSTRKWKITFYKRAVPRPPGRCEFSSHGASMMTILNLPYRSGTKGGAQGQSEWLENVPMLNELYRLTFWLFNITMENHHL